MVAVSAVAAVADSTAEAVAADSMAAVVAVDTAADTGKQTVRSI